jgi:histidinol-phosphate aminotransferase
VDGDTKPVDTRRAELLCSCQQLAGAGLRERKPMGTLTDEQKRDVLRRGFTRRSFSRFAAMMGAGAAALPFYNEPALAQLPALEGEGRAGAVLINANENPLGPCKEAREAAARMVERGGRYFFGESGRLQQLLAGQEGLPASHVRIAAGSSGPLHQAVLAFTSPTRPLVTADPAYEAPEGAARFIGAKVLRVPLTRGYAHDVKAMVAASPEAGLFYLCNPNNPTGTLTPREDIEWLVANKPAGAVVMIDEAYTHIAGVPFQTPLVAAGKDVVILRTFSKIYGMAGLRAGAALARPDLLEKLGGFSQTMMPTPGMAAAIASLQARSLVPERRKLIAEVREDVFEFFDKHNVKYVRSVSNCFMVEGGRPGRQMASALARENVYVGRAWPSWPNHVRVTVGTREEMDQFKKAFLKVMA